MIFHPVRSHNQMIMHVVVVGVRVWIVFRVLSHNDPSIMPIYLVMPRVAMIELSSRFRCQECVAESC